MDYMWSISTTLREPARIMDFLSTAKRIDGEPWNNDTQVKYQTLLIQERKYLDGDNTQSLNKLSDEQVKILKDTERDMTFEEAKEIFEAKEYVDPYMRGRQSLSPLTKLGLIDKSDGFVRITKMGNKLLDGVISLEEFLFKAMLMYQYPNPGETEHKDWESKPFISTLRLIKRVNELCQKRGIKAKGLTKIEFGIFAITMKSYKDVDLVAELVLEFRRDLDKLSKKEDKDEYIERYVKKYLPDFKKPEKNRREYTDNVVRYLRVTKYIIVRGKYGHACVDIEPRRMIEVDSILKHDSGEPLDFKDEASWQAYIGDDESYILPFETIHKLTEILNFNLDDIHLMEDELGLPKTSIVAPTKKEDFKNEIAVLRNRRTQLQNLIIKNEALKDLSKIDETIDALKNIRNQDLAPSIALEKWANIALNIINDAKLIKPNTIVGDDNEPTFTAPGGVPDIECYYDKFNAVCEVTMLTGRDQWYNEGQPVMRHLRAFEEKDTSKNSYCLFVAPKMHTDSINTFWTSVKYEYEGKSQRIVPLTINQLVEVLETVKEVRKKGGTWTHEDVMKFYDECCNIHGVSSSLLWGDHIGKTLENWKNGLLSA